MRVLHLGCGRDIRKGWVNIDQEAETFFRKDGTVSLSIDLRNGIPFEDDYFDFVYSSHFFEHIDTVAGYNLLVDCRRVLRSDGTIRLCLPNAKQLLDAYYECNDEWFEQTAEMAAEGLPPYELRTKIDHVTRGIGTWGHVCFYDYEKAAHLLVKAGFVNVHEVEHDPTIDLNNPRRIAFSFYATANNPTKESPAD